MDANKAFASIRVYWRFLPVPLLIGHAYQITTKVILILYGIALWISDSSNTSSRVPGEDDTFASRMDNAIRADGDGVAIGIRYTLQAGGLVDDIDISIYAGKLISS